jgi:hypothetical protein
VRTQPPPPAHVFWNPTGRALTAPLRDALRRERERYVVATGPTVGFGRVVHG